MRFRFCGGLDCPDWVLKEIELLSLITSVRIKVITGEVIKAVLGQGEIDFDKVTKLSQLKERTITHSDIKAVIAALHFIICNGAKYDVDDVTLANELQQLGLPKEHCDTICRSYIQSKDQLRQKFAEQTLQLPRVSEVDWRVEYILASNSLEHVNTPSVGLKLAIRSPLTNEVVPHTFTLSADKFRVLYNELKTARSLMANVYNEPTSQ